LCWFDSLVDCLCGTHFAGKGQRKIMKTQVVHNYDELQDVIKMHSDVYCLLYKPESELSECAAERLEKAAETGENGILCHVDVTQVRDIHPKYNITVAPTLLVFKNGKQNNQIKGCNDASFYENLMKGSYFVSTQDDGKPQKRVTVYTTPTCTYCNSLKRYLDSLQVPYREVDVSKEQEQANVLMQRTGQQGVPQTDINGKFVVGFDKNKIDQLLEIN